MVRAKLKGKGRSTAEILGSLAGNVRTEVTNGTMSHLIIEAAGLDAAEALGVWFRGDDVLEMKCAFADLEANNGVLRPRVFVIDTPDSALWGERHNFHENRSLEPSGGGNTQRFSAR